MKKGSRVLGVKGQKSEVRGQRSEVRRGMLYFLSLIFILFTVHCLIPCLNPRYIPYKMAGVFSTGI